MIGSLLLIATALVGQTPTAEADTLKVEVRKLVHQLDSPRLEKREAAEKRLIELGPEVLPLLPEPNEDMSAEVKKRMDSIRHQVQETAAKTSAQASVVTLHSPGMKLSKILADFQKQTGNPIIDDRAQPGQPVTDPELKADFDKTPFWKALDTVLDQAGLAADAFSRHHGICVVARASGQAPRSHGTYSGPFRFEAVRIFASRDLRNPAGDALMLGLEVAWEPRLRPVGLKQPMADIVAQDENGKPLAVDDRKADGESLVQTDASAVVLDLSMALPSRRVNEIARFRGSLQATVPGKMETFRFGDLLTAKNVEKRIAGVTVILDQVQKNNGLWEVPIRVRFDEAGNSLETFRNWILQNEALLEDPDGKALSPFSQDMTLEDKNEIGLTYLFQLKDPPRKWKFVYKTPGLIVTTAFPYELKDIKLP